MQQSSSRAGFRERLSAPLGIGVRLLLSLHRFAHKAALSIDAIFLCIRPKEASSGFVCFARGGAHVSGEFGWNSCDPRS
jgi:hypothetical protein